MKSFFGAVKSIVIVMLLVLAMGFGMVQLRNCLKDNPVIDEPVTEDEDITLNETEIVF